MTETPLHYRLTNEEWLKAVRELTESQKDVLYYLRTLDPYGDRKLELGVRELARILGIDPATVSRALKVLDAKGYIDLEITHARVKLSSKTKTLHQNNSVAPEQQCCTRTTSTIATQHSVAPEQHSRSPRNTRASEPAQDNDSGTPQTDQTDHTYLNSLSNDPPPTLEREQTIDQEELIEWVAKQNQQARNPRAYAIKCIKANKKYWIEKYHQYRERANSLPKTTTVEIDLSEILAGIEIHLRRLGWSKQQAIAWMVDHHRWKLVAFDRLLDEDLEHLLSVLEGVP